MMVGRLAGRADALPHHQHKTLAKQLIKLINIVSHNIDYGIYSYFPPKPLVNLQPANLSYAGFRDDEQSVLNGAPQHHDILYYKLMWSATTSS
ncbi:hypothetical protein [Bradyrhizobium elkanii]